MIDAAKTRRRARNYIINLPMGEVKRLNECSTEEIMLHAMELIDTLSEVANKSEKSLQAMVRLKKHGR